MLDRLPAHDLFTWLLVFVRTGAAVSLLPGFSAAYVPARIRLLLALGISLLVAPLLSATLPAMPDAPLALGVLIGSEALIGFFLGSIPRIAFSALHVGGTFVAFFGSFANALAQDPVVEEQSSTIAGFFSTLGLVLVFATDLHHLMLRAVVESYALFPSGVPAPIGGLSEVLTRCVGDAFSLGLELAAPFLIVSLVYNVGLGLLGRLMPNLQVFFFGLPLQLGLHIWVIILTISGIMLVFLNRFALTVKTGLEG